MRESLESLSTENLCISDACFCLLLFLILMLAIFDNIIAGRFQRGKFMYLLSTSSVVVTAMYFAPQISALFVGYSFGGFQCTTYQPSSSSTRVLYQHLSPQSHT